MSRRKREASRRTVVRIARGDIQRIEVVCDGCEARVVVHDEEGVVPLVTAVLSTRERRELARALMR